MDHNTLKLNRRDFLKLLGGTAAGAALAACTNNSDDQDASSRLLPADKTSMTMRTNHNSGDKVSILGYGMMRLPTKKVTEGDNVTEVIDQDEVNALVDLAMDYGVNYYDTSPVYMQGKSEEATGIALSRHPRDKYFIATKLSNFSPETQSREKSIEMFETSLKNLQTDYIDYLLLHAIGDMDGFNARFIDNGMLDYLKEQKEAGRIRNLGWSFHGDPDFFDEMLRWHDEGKVHWDFIQIQLNYYDWFRPDDYASRGIDAEYLYNELAKRDIPAVLMEPLLGGRLASLPRKLSDKMRERRPQQSVASWAFRFAGHYPNILTVLSGMTYTEHLQDNLLTYSPLEPLTDDEMAFLKDLTLQYIDQYDGKNDEQDESASDATTHAIINCTRCKYCMPCPYGVDIPTIFQHYNKCVNEDNAPTDNRDPRYAEARKAFLSDYDRQVPRLRQAAMCTQCGECEGHCPQHLPIRRLLSHIDAYTSRLRHGQA